MLGNAEAEKLVVWNCGLNIKNLCLMRYQCHFTYFRPTSLKPKDIGFQHRTAAMQVFSYSVYLHVPNWVVLQKSKNYETVSTTISDCSQSEKILLLQYKETILKTYT